MAEIAHQVRISAQRLEDGRVRFGMRTGAGPGGWIEPVGPTVNSFEPSLQRAGRWLSSSALTLQLDGDTYQLVRSDLFGASEPEAVELVSGLSAWSHDIYPEAGTADRVALIEFALLQREPGGDWSERILPGARQMPAYGGATRWVSSTPVSVHVKLTQISPRARIVEAEQGIVQPPTSPRLAAGCKTPNAEYAAEYEPGTQRVSSRITVHGDDGLRLIVGCSVGQYAVNSAGIPSDASGELTLALDGVRSSVTWAVARSTDQLRPADVGRLMQRLRAASRKS